MLRKSGPATGPRYHNVILMPVGMVVSWVFGGMWDASDIKTALLALQEWSRVNITMKYVPFVGYESAVFKLRAGVD